MTTERMYMGVGTDGTLLYSTVEMKPGWKLCPVCEGSGRDPYAEGPRRRDEDYDDSCDKCRGHGEIELNDGSDI